MSDDDRINALREGVAQAQDALARLDDAQKNQNAEYFNRLEQALGYAAVVLERTDPALVSDSVQQQLAETLGQIANNPQQVAANPDGWMHQLMTQLALLPASGDHDFEQSVRDAAANFRRSVSAHLNAVDSDVAALRERIAEAEQDLGTKREEAVAEVEELRTGFEARLTQIEAAATTAKQSIEQQAASQQEDFETAEERREKTVTKAWQELRERLEADAARLVADMERMRDDVKALVGAVGAAGTANHYGAEAKRERKASWMLFGLTVLLLVSAVGVGIWAASKPNIEIERFIAKLVISGVVAGAAAYTGARARDHREREKRARDLELELRAFGPFIEPLPERQRTLERVVMTRRTFGRNGKDDEITEADLVQPTEE